MSLTSVNDPPISNPHPWPQPVSPKQWHTNQGTHHSPQLPSHSTLIMNPLTMGTIWVCPIIQPPRAWRQRQKSS